MHMRTRTLSLLGAVAHVLAAAPPRGQASDGVSGYASRSLGAQLGALAFHNEGQVFAADGFAVDTVPCGYLEPEVSTRILGRRTAPFPPFLILNRSPHGFKPRS